MAFFASWSCINKNINRRKVGQILWIYLGYQQHWHQSSYHSFDSKVQGVADVVEGHQLGNAWAVSQPRHLPICLFCPLIVPFFWINFNWLLIIIIILTLELLKCTPRLLSTGENVCLGFCYLKRWLACLGPLKGWVGLLGPLRHTEETALNLFIRFASHLLII